jgi:hypothetical protein
MADNSSEAPLENQTNMPPENPPGQIIPDIETATIAQNQATETMEVHHHPNVEKKNFKEYFLEFLMIFLAVTMGFIAENIRENVKEHEAAKVYAASMVNDLKEDTTQLKSYLSYMTYASGNVDSFLKVMTVDDIKNIPSGKLYWYGLFGGAENNFTANDATFQQMKSSGSLRYFSNTVLAGEVAKYDRLCRQMQARQEADHYLSLEVRKSRSLLFELKYNMQANDIYQSNRNVFNQQRIDAFLLSQPPLLSYDKIIFNQYAEMVRSRFHKNYVKEAGLLLTKATALITVLKKEYHLESE